MHSYVVSVKIVTLHVFTVLDKIQAPCILLYCFTCSGYDSPLGILPVLAISRTCSTFIVGYTGCYELQCLAKSDSLFFDESEI